MASSFFPDDATESQLSDLASAYEGLSANSQQLNTVVGPLINAVAGGISANDAALNKVNGVVKSTLTRATNANAAQLATVTQPLQTAVAAQAGELSAQTAMVAQSAAAANPPSSYTPPPEPSSSGTTYQPTPGAMLPITGYLRGGFTGSPFEDAAGANPDVKQEAFGFNGQIGDFPLGKPISKNLYLIQDGLGNPLNIGIQAGRPLTKGLVPPGANMPKQLLVQEDPNIPAAMLNLPPGGIETGFFPTGWVTATGTTTGMPGGGGRLPGGVLPISTPSPPTLPVLPITKPPGGQQPTPTPIQQPTPIVKPINGGQQPTPTPISNPIQQPTPTPQPIQQPTPTPGPIQLPKPIQTPTPPPGQQPTPTPIQQPTPTPQPIGQPTPTPIQQPTPTPQPVTMPIGKPTPTPTPINLPIGKPIPTPTPIVQPTPTPINKQPTGGGTTTTGGGGVNPTYPQGGGILTPTPTPIGQQYPIPPGGQQYPTQPTGGGGQVYPTSPGGGLYPTFPIGGGGSPVGQFPGVNPVVQNYPITTTTTNPITGQQTTISFTQNPYGGVNVTVSPCCATPEPDKPGELPQPQTPPQPNVRVMGAGDERPDDVAGGSCSVIGSKFFMPVPGTVEWCKLQAQIVKDIAALGKQVLHWLQDQVQALYNKEEANANLPDPTFSSPLSLVSDLWTLLIRAIGRVSTPILQTLWNYLCSIQRGIVQIGQCQTDAYIGCSVILCVIKILKRTRLGTDAGVWATVDAVLDFPSIEVCISYVMNSICPVNIPGPGDAMEAYLTGWLDETRYKCWLNAHGYSEENMSHVLRARREKLSTDEFIQWCRRNKIDDSTTSSWLRFYGWLDEAERNAALDLYDELPTISDHLHWLQRNVFDDAYVKDYNLMEGFEDRFWTKFGGDLRALGMKKEYAALHYAAHWINPSPGQLFEMLRRLRPGRVDPSVQFTENDLLRLLAEQDVAPYFRERFRQIAYVPFGLRFLRQLYDTRQIDDAEASQRFQDLGYKPTDGDMLVKSEQIRRARTIATQTQGFTASNIRKLYIAGKMKNPEAIQRLGQLGYPEQPANDAIDAWKRLQDVKVQDDGSKHARAALIDSAKQAVQLGVVTEQQAQQSLMRVGFSADNSSSLVSSWVTLDRVRITKVGIGQIKKGVMTGQLALGDAAPLLQHLGLTEAKVNEYINVWTYDLQAGKRHLAWGEINRMLTEGLMDATTARVRLANLNYADPDAMLLLSEAAYRIQQNEQRVAAAELRTKEMQAKQLMLAIQRNKQQLARMQKQLTGLGTVSKLVKWYREGLIGPAYLTSRLLAIGYQQVDIDLTIEEANIEGQPKKGAVPVTPVNPGVRSTGTTPGSAGS